MDASQFRRWLVRVALVGVALAVVLRLLLGGQWFSLYGFATVFLVTLPFVHRLLKLRLPLVGRSPRSAWLYTLPVGLMGLVQVLFWSAFFSSPDSGVKLGIARMMFWQYGGRFVPIALTLLLLAWIVMFARAAGPDRVGLAGHAPTAA